MITIKDLQINHVGQQIIFCMLILSTCFEVPAKLVYNNSLKIPFGIHYILLSWYDKIDV